jgi:BirA family biotin operon repressor/biotin-[acetyl-CoA-carboxylase] ligase
MQSILLRRIKQPANMFDTQEIQQQTFVRQVVHHRQLPSTNDLALQLARAPSTELPALVICDQQTAGRGRGRNRWWSADGGLTFSVIVDARSVSLEHLSRVSLAAGLAVLRGAAPFVPVGGLGLKWPNDVYLGTRKLAGILVEAPAHPPQRLVIGIGINVNNDFQGAPREVCERATSLALDTGRVVSRQEVLLSVLEELAGQLDRLWQGDPSLATDWQQVCILQGRWVEVDAYSHRASGWCQGIDPQGALVLRSDVGMRRFLGGVVCHFQ